MTGILEQLFELAAAQRSRAPQEIPPGDVARLRALSAQARLMSVRVQAPTPADEPSEPWAR